MCAKGSERKFRQSIEEEAHAGAAADFQSYGRPLEALVSFKCLRKVLTASGDDWPAEVSNMRNVQ